MLGVSVVESRLWLGFQYSRNYPHLSELSKRENISSHQDVSRQAYSTYPTAPPSIPPPGRAPSPTLRAHPPLGTRPTKHQRCQLGSYFGVCGTWHEMIIMNNESDSDVLEEPSPVRRIAIVTGSVR